MLAPLYHRSTSPFATIVSSRRERVHLYPLLPRLLGVNCTPPLARCLLLLFLLGQDCEELRLVRRFQITVLLAWLVAWIYNTQRDSFVIPQKISEEGSVLLTDEKQSQP